MAAEIVMYTRAFCGYCAAAKKLFDEKKIHYEEIDCTLSAEKRREMRERSGHQTFPQIFIGDQHVGGYDDVAALDATGELDSFLHGDE